MFDVEKIRADFPILGRQVHGRPLVYLDNAATAQKPRAVVERMDEILLTLNANVHRGIHFLSEQCTEAYEAAREQVRIYMNARARAEVVFTSGATAAINLVAYSYGGKFVRRGDNIVVSAMEHHANLVPWQQLCERAGAELRVIPIEDDGRLTEEKLPELLDARTRMVAVTQASNVLGTKPDLHKIVAAAHAAGAPVLVDGCQGIVHGGVDVRALDCDFYVFSGHKLYGPTGIGVLYGKERWLEQMPPFLTGGEMVRSVSLERATWAELPLKFEAGTPNYVGAIGLGAAIDYLCGIDLSAALTHENALLKRATERLEALDGITIHGRRADKCPIVSFTARGVPAAADIGMILDKLGIAVRTGHHCAEPLMARCDVETMCRASMAFYNTPGEVDALAEGVERALKMLRK